VLFDLFTVSDEDSSFVGGSRKTSASSLPMSPHSPPPDHNHSDSSTIVSDSPVAKNDFHFDGNSSSSKKSEDTLSKMALHTTGQYCLLGFMGFICGTFIVGQPWFKWKTRVAIFMELEKGTCTNEKLKARSRGSRERDRLGSLLPSKGCPGCHPGKFLKICIQIGAVWCI
jgi:hypothetical protein